MGLRETLARWAARRPHSLVVAAPGASDVRWAVERHLLATGGVLSTSPADADLLVVVGQPGPELAAIIEQVWDQMPGPRSRTSVVDVENVEAALAAARTQLANPHRTHHRSAAGVDGPTDRSEVDHQDPLLDNGDEQDSGQADDAEQHPQAAHQGHSEPEDMRGTEMPGGLMMADRADDRDGLKLDVLHVPLGPVLPHWPAGLVVDVVLSGDVVASAEGRVLPTGVLNIGEPHAITGIALARRHLDAATSILAVAGADAAAAHTRRLRDLLTDDPSPSHQDLRALGALSRRIRRTPGLRRQCVGVGELTGEDAAHAGLPAGYVGDAWDRLLARVGAARDHAGTDSSGNGDAHADDHFAPAHLSDVLAAAVRLMVGYEFAEARLVLASFDPDTDSTADAAPAAPVTAVSPTGHGMHR